MLRDDISNDDGVIDDVVANKVSVQIYVAPCSKETKTLEVKRRDWEGEFVFLEFVSLWGEQCCTFNTTHSWKDSLSNGCT